MVKISILGKKGVKTLYCNQGDKLSDLLIKNGIYVEHPCGGKGKCLKCSVLVDGKTELSCKYTIDRDITLKIPEQKEILSDSGVKSSEVFDGNCCLCLDIGTTTLALSLLSENNFSAIKTVTRTNPQRVFGADVISRIDYSIKNGSAELNRTLINAVNSMINEILTNTKTAPEKLYVAGNMTMLHLFLGLDCRSLGKSPYTPAFLESKCESAKSLGIEKVSTVITLPNISAFVGADIVAGLNYLPEPSCGKHSLLVDLGTNAEVVLFGKDKILCTAAAAGPCFEGANISSGMAAVEGAVYSFKNSDIIGVICDGKAIGICGTGLIDIIAYLLKADIVNQAGYMANERFKVADGVYIEKNDIRQFQLAKSAVYSAVLCLLKQAKITFSDIESLYVSGGFSGKLNIESAVFTGLLPTELKDKIKTVNNSSLLGTIKFAKENSIDLPLDKAEYIDLSANPLFSELFIDNMCFLL